MITMLNSANTIVLNMQSWCAKLLLMSQGRININVAKLPSSRITNELQPNYILSIKLLEGRLESYICMFCLLSTDQAFK